MTQATKEQTMQRQKFDDRIAHAEAIRISVEDSGRWSDGRHELELSGPVVSVRDLGSGLLVAYSATYADRQGSLEEFTWDFFVSGGV